jgi:hypothetical protein
MFCVSDTPKANHCQRIQVGYVACAFVIIGYMDDNVYDCGGIEQQTGTWKVSCGREDCG